jgi:putative transcriptional regulator
MVTRARLKDDGTVVEVLRDGSERPIVPEVDWARVDATTEAEIAAQIAADDAEAMRDAAAYARRVRRKIGLSQVAFARRIGVPVDTVRNWEQGKRAPRGPPGAAAHHRSRPRSGAPGSRQKLTDRRRPHQNRPTILPSPARAPRSCGSEHTAGMA